MEYPTSHMYFLVTHKNPKLSVYAKKIQVTSGIVIGTIILMRESVAFHAIENTVVNTIDAIYVWCRMGRSDLILLNMQWLSCIPIGCVFCVA